jgi:hypothetical protein
MQRVESLSRRILDIEGQDIQGTLNEIKRKLIAETLKELFTPIQMQHNVDINKCRKLIEEQSQQVQD